MYIGHLLMANANVLSEWFSREADNAVFTWQQIQASAGTTLTVTIWHKNRDEIGPGTEITTAWTTSGSFRYFRATGLRELVRFEYTVSNTPAVGTVQVDDVPSLNNLDVASVGWIMYRMLEPTWFDTPNA